MKLKVQAQHLQPGDIVGSGEIIKSVVNQSLHWPTNKVCVRTDKRDVLWGKYTGINIERPEKVEKLDAYSEAVLFATGHLPEDF